MKKIIVIMLMVLFCITVMAQQKEKEETNEKGTEVPALVKAAFQKDYPNVKTVKWSAEDYDFEAEFKQNGVDFSANYNKEGKRVEVEMDIETNQLPKATIDYISKNYPNTKISEAAKISDEKNVISFEAEVKENGKSFDLIFDADGKFLSKKQGE